MPRRASITPSTTPRVTTRTIGSVFFDAHGVVAAESRRNVAVDFDHALEWKARLAVCREAGERRGVFVGREATARDDLRFDRSFVFDAPVSDHDATGDRALLE